MWNKYTHRSIADLRKTFKICLWYLLLHPTHAKFFSNQVFKHFRQFQGLTKMDQLMEAKLFNQRWISAWGVMNLIIGQLYACLHPNISRVYDLFGIRRASGFDNKHHTQHPTCLLKYENIQSHLLWVSRSRKFLYYFPRIFFLYSSFLISFYFSDFNFIFWTCVCIKITFIIIFSFTFIYFRQMSFLDMFLM